MALAVLARQIIRDKLLFNFGFFGTGTTIRTCQEIQCLLYIRYLFTVAMTVSVWIFMCHQLHS